MLDPRVDADTDRISFARLLDDRVGVFVRPVNNSTNRAAT